MKNLGTIGRLRVYSDVNYDRDVPSTQIWVEFIKHGSVFGTASGTSVTETGEIECDNSDAFKLTARELARLEEIMERHEGAPVVAKNV
jgi:hypothetical protein